MKIIISAGDGTKREINGAFSVCGSREDLLLLVDELSRSLNNTSQLFAYGWVEIIPCRPKSIANTPPIPWESA